MANLWHINCLIIPPNDNYRIFKRALCMQAEDSEVHAVAQEILGYLAKRPGAADTMEGIRKWWLWRHYVERSREKVQKALDLLVRQGLVEQVCLQGGQMVYARSKRAGSTPGGASPSRP